VRGNGRFVPESLSASVKQTHQGDLAIMIS
jgi:hypothetical protein